MESEPLNPVFWTLLSSLSFASCYILARRGTVYCNVTLGTLIATGVNLFIMTIWALSTTPRAALADGRLWVFCLIGLFVPGISRLLLILSVHKVGASRSSSIRAAAPLIATLAAVLWLKESPTLFSLAGIGAIVLGGVFLSRKSRNEPLWNRRDLISPDEERPSPQGWMYFGAFPLGGTVLTAFRDVSVRFGLADYPYPVAGFWAATAVSMLVVLVYWRWTRSPDEERPSPQGWMYFGALGVGVSVGFTTLFFAFQAGEVVVVSPVTGTTPLFTLFLSAMFLRGLDRLTVPVIAGSALIVLGSVLVALRI